MRAPPRRRPHQPARPALTRPARSGHPRRVPAENLVVSDAETVDAVVVGAGHNGLVAANMLADRGWSVRVLEASDGPGGAVRTEEITAPGFRSDLGSAFYPMGVVSPAFRALDLSSYGLEWRHAPSPLAHVLPDDRGVLLSRDVDVTAASLDRFAARRRGRLATARRRVAAAARPAARRVPRAVPAGARRRPGAADARRPRRAPSRAPDAAAGDAVRRGGVRRGGRAGPRRRERPAHRPRGEPDREHGVRLAARDARAGRRVPGARGRRAGDHGRAGGAAGAPGRDRGVPSSGDARPRRGRPGGGGRRRGRRAGAGAARGARRRPRAGAVRRPRGHRAPAGTDGRRPRPVPVRRRDPQGRLGAVVPDPVDRAGAPRGGHGAPRRGRGGARRLRRRPRGRPHAARAVHAARADDARRPAALAARHGVGVGVHAPAAPPGAHGGGARRAGRAHGRGASSATRRASASASSRGSCPGPATSRPATRRWCAGRSWPARPRCTRCSCSARRPGLGRPDTPVERLFLAGATAHPAGAVHGAPGANAARAALARGGRLGALYGAGIRAGQRLVYGADASQSRRPVEAHHPGRS